MAPAAPKLVAGLAVHVAGVSDFCLLLTTRKITSLSSTCYSDLRSIIYYYSVKERRLNINIVFRKTSLFDKEILGCF